MRISCHYLPLLGVFNLVLAGAASAQPSNTDTFQVDSINLANNNSIQLKWHSATNAYYQVQYANALATNPAWQFASTNFSSTGTTSVWSDGSAPDASPQRYYRMVQSTNLVDRFGITEIYSTITNGREWFSTWDNGHARSLVAFGATNQDPYDPWWDINHDDASFYIDGNGIMMVTGSPRMYVHDPDVTDAAAQVDWHHGIEATMYGRRVSDQNTAYAGLEIVVRSNHGTTAPELQNLCDTRGIDGRMRNDGHIDFEKETCHPNSVAVSNKTYWAGGMPFNTWIGYKLCVYDLTNGFVKMELYLDETDGMNGGNWKKINELTDYGTNFGVGGVPCTNGIDPALRLTESDIRPGSESGRPNITVYSRTDNVNSNGMWYKRESIREIAPPGAMQY